ncbi:RHS repeat-associated core domain-containing protein, partial [Vibrio harveyi]|uniref:RHS repeat-associated core domain-containing protein n=1 Tax=Vibrio harveyi TaxID=669 RepID=UPI000A930DA4
SNVIGSVLNGSNDKGSLLSLGFQGSQNLSTSHLSLMGSRAYDKRIGRFLQHDDLGMSPFGRGGVHGYAFVNGNPISNRDPSGRFAILSVLIGAITGAFVGATISAISEGIKVASTGESFDWKQVVIGASIGAISGSFGAASSGVSGGAKVGLAISDAMASGIAEFGINLAFGDDVKAAGISSLTGAIVGLSTFGIGSGLGKAYKGVSKLQSRVVTIRNNGLSGRGAPRAAGAMANASQHQGDSLSVLERLMQQPTIYDALERHMDNRTVGRLRGASRQMNELLEDSFIARRENLRGSLQYRITETEPIIKRNSRAQTRLMHVIELGIQPEQHQVMLDRLMDQFGQLSRIQRDALVEQKRRFPADYAVSASRYPHLQIIYQEHLR